jgi:hypothetical protein
MVCKVLLDFLELMKCKFLKVLLSNLLVLLSKLLLTILLCLTVLLNLLRSLFALLCLLFYILSYQVVNAGRRMPVTGCPVFLG